jgi:hypothetical protein
MLRGGLPRPAACRHGISSKPRPPGASLELSIGAPSLLCLLPCPDAASLHGPSRTRLPRPHEPHDQKPPQIVRLKELEAASKDKLITFDEALFNEFALSADRPYHLVLFGSAHKFMESPKLMLNKLKEEFIYVAKVRPRRECVTAG